MNKTNVFIISEVSSNHSRDIDRAKAFIRASKQIGCDAVKFQLFKIDQLFSPEILGKSQEHRRRKQWELPVEFLPILASECRAIGIQFSCTPFYLEAVSELEPHVDFYKIASYELLWDGLLAACAKTGKPVVLSTGMATMPEIAHAVEVLRSHGCADPTLLHCTSSYPTPHRESNLSAIGTLRGAFNCPVGWSDHTVDPAVLHRAIHRWGVEMIEFHLDLDGQGDEFKAGHCWLPEQMATVIAQIRRSLECDGDGVKEPVPSELSDRAWRADPSDGLRPLLHVRRTF
jgi:N-acetylneuraminate synthase